MNKWFYFESHIFSHNFYKLILMLYIYIYIFFGYTLASNASLSKFFFKIVFCDSASEYPLPVLCKILWNIGTEPVLTIIWLEAAYKNVAYTYYLILIIF